MPDETEGSSDDLPNMSLVEKLDDARRLLDEVARELDPRENTVTDEELVGIVMELCLTRPELAAQSMVAARRQLYEHMPVELAKLLGLDADQRRKLSEWIRNRIMKIDPPEAPDLFDMVKKQ